MKRPGPGPPIDGDFDNPPPAVKKVKPLVSPEALAQRSAALQANPRAPDVRVVFPKGDGKVLELWTYYSLLAEVSPYLQVLLDSDFAEGGKLTAKQRVKQKLDQPFGDNRTENDLDEPADQLVLGANDTAQSTSATDHGLAYHQIEVTEACYTTYRAFLVWLNSGHLAFADVGDTDQADRQPKLEDLLKNKPHLPLPSSPLSVYKLAHFLDVPELMALALADLNRKLTAENVADVLFSDLSLHHKGIKDKASRFAANRWQNVRKSQAFLAVAKAVKEGKADEFAGIAFELLQQVYVEDYVGFH